MELQKLVKRFPRGFRDEVLAVDSFTGKFAGSGLLVLVGPNGCGKTTLANLLAGTHFPDSGTISLDGHDITQTLPGLRTFIGRVYQDPALGSAPYLTVCENLCLAQVVGQNVFRRAVTKDRVQRAGSALRTLGIEDAFAARRLMSALAKTLSGGERQLLNLAMLALRAPAPRIVIADEPTASLDPLHAEKCLDILTRMADTMAVLLITHRLEIARSAPQVWVMARGRLVADIELPEGIGEFERATRTAYELQ